MVEETGEGRWACQGVDRPDAAITAVLTRLVQVDPLELTWIQSPRRQFVAAEMTAFLLAWLEGLGCPVIDRPSPGCLCGRNWGWSHWAAHASGLGIPVRDQGPDPGRTRLVTMVGDTVIGAGADEEAAWARRLGAGAGQEMASFRFQGEGPARALVQARVGLDRVGAAELDALDRLLEQRLEAG
ncbi:hypothetical protein KBZ08_13860 [Cyanobium sp. Candia 9D4]|uniref:hypothetical protein n=1 Tax=Cyanobium sp. Candia 9D4 TaxID=2823707 RepID=UPI0020CD380F|nr:hypothetical protein [Cyanobium sp. Candia 9D4]MCP9934996.1 hypothetical protein [Cyanobium sp. Candia 9D4]